jgi:hypothetical protein
MLAPGLRPNDLVEPHDKQSDEALVERARRLFAERRKLRWQSLFYCLDKLMVYRLLESV